MTSPNLLADIEREEGCKLHAYRDSLGVWTCGVGHTAGVTATTVYTAPDAIAILHDDVAAVEHGLDARLSWWRKLSDNRQDVLVQMAFQMGVDGLLGFRMTLAAVRIGQYTAAAAGMRNSTWANQTPARANRMASQMETDLRAWAWADGK